MEEKAGTIPVLVCYRCPGNLIPNSVQKVTLVDGRSLTTRPFFSSFRNRVILQARLAHLKTHKRINTPFIVWEGRSRHLAESENEATELEAQSLLNYRL